MSLAAALEQAARGIEGETFADAGEDIGEIAVFRSRVAHPAGRHQRQPQIPRQIDERLIAMLFGAKTMALELDVEPVGKEVMEMLEFAPGGVESTVKQTLGEDPLGAAGETEEAVGVGLDLAPTGAGLALGPAACGLGEETAEVTVAATVARQEREPGQGSAGWGRVGHEAQRPRKF